MGNGDSQENDNLYTKNKDIPKVQDEKTAWTKLIVIFFLILGIYLGYKVYKREGNILKNLPNSGNIISSSPVLRKEINLTNKNDNETVEVKKNDIINLSLRLNRKATNKLEISNLNVLEENQPLTFDNQNDLFKTTIKVIGEGQSSIGINELPKCLEKQKCPPSISIFKIKVNASNN